MCRVQAPSRLHFGLLRLPGRDDPTETFARRFGGVGLMVKEPGIALSVIPAAGWSADGPLAERALGYAQQFARALSLHDRSPCHVIVEHCAPEHAGLGTGTQLGLAVAR